MLLMGHVVSADDIRPDPTKVQAVRGFSVPTDVQSVCEFLGLASYCRHFVPNFTSIAGPLHLLTQEAFDQL